MKMRFAASTRAFAGNVGSSGGGILTPSRFCLFLLRRLLQEGPPR